MTDYFTHLCNDTSKNILINLRNNELVNLLLTQKKNGLVIKNLIEKNKKNKKIYFQYLTIAAFKETFLPLNLVINIPRFENTDRFLGSTDYIDRVRPKHMPFPVMFGIDRYKRPFISVKYQCRDESFKQYGDVIDIKKTKKVITVFQRYTNIKSSWCKAGSVSYNCPLLSNNGSLLLRGEDKILFVQNLYHILYNNQIIHKELDNNCNLVGYHYMDLN